MNSQSDAKNLFSLNDVVTRIINHTHGHLVLAAPLGIGKPHRLLNAIYDAIANEPAHSLQIYTALSLTPPDTGTGLQQRFLAPFSARHFGSDFVSLHYAMAQRKDALPTNIHVEEFYMQSGALLNSTQAQQNHSSLNYTHVARAVAARNLNVMVQKVAREPNGTRLCLSCNPDLTFDLMDEIKRLGKPRPLLVAEVDSQLPFIGGSAAVAADFFDLVIDLPGPAPALFALPRQPVSDAEYAIGLRASALIKDGGCLQIGIGSLSDALCHALILRHTRNVEYKTLLDQLAPGFSDSELVQEFGGTAPFMLGLYGASEMVNDGFMRLRQAGILTRRVINDVDAMKRLNHGTTESADLVRLEREGHWLNGGFYLGSHDLYDWLRRLPESEKRGIGMTRISHINELYGGNETLERLQRRDARFFNTCMMMTALGSAISDGLEDGRVVSGVGGQYNFVAMAHALHDGRSILMFRAIRESGQSTDSNVLWNYGHCTIPRHLRDIAISEYGVADLRGADDAECIDRMLALCDARFQEALIATAKKAKKISSAFTVSEKHSVNTEQHLKNLLAPHRKSGLLPDYPLGCDFTPVEQRLARALSCLKTATPTWQGKLQVLLASLLPMQDCDDEALERMRLHNPNTLSEWLEARMLKLALQRTNL